MRHLIESGVVYKKTEPIAMKAEAEGQVEFIEKFEPLPAEKEADEAHYFIEAAHPT